VTLLSTSLRPDEEIADDVRGLLGQILLAVVGRGGAFLQACRGQPARRQVTDLGRHALLARRDPVPDDRSGQFAYPGGGQGVRVGGEAAGEPIAQPGRKNADELRDAVRMPAGNQRLRPGGTHRLFERGGRLSALRPR